jgi:hypothetical protein
MRQIQANLFVKPEKFELVEIIHFIVRVRLIGMLLIMLAVH